MCGRFTASFNLREIRIRFGVQTDFPLFAPRFNIAPSQEVPVIVRREGGNEFRPMRWGLVPSRVKDHLVGSNMINARAETLEQKPSFKGLLERRRCLVPADGFYEWRSEGKRKVPVWIHLKNKEPFAFAGLWDVWKQPPGGELFSFTIITTQANALLRPIHHRMPVMFDGLSGTRWLDPSLTAPRALSALLEPLPPEGMEVYDVSPLVNSPANDMAECIQPASDDEPPSQLSLI